MLFNVAQDPFEGLAASVVTSHHIDVRDAYRLTMSVRTISGTSSVLSYEVSNSASRSSDIAEASWSHDTIFGLESGKSMLSPPLGVRWGRIIRTVSGGSYVFEINKMVR